MRRPRRSNQSGPPQKRSFCGEPNRRAQAPWVRIPHSPPDKKEGRKALFYVLQRKVPRLRARRTASTFHRRKVDRKAAGGPFYQRRNAPRSPPFAHAEDGFCSTPAPRLPRGLAFSCGGRGTKGDIPAPWLPLTRELSPQATEGENSQQAPSAHPASQQARSISPSVKPFGFATSLVRGRQDKRRGDEGKGTSDLLPPLPPPHSCSTIFFKIWTALAAAPLRI